MDTFIRPNLAARSGKVEWHVMGCTMASKALGSNPTAPSESSNIRGTRWTQALKQPLSNPLDPP